MFNVPTWNFSEEEKIVNKIESYQNIRYKTFLKVYSSKKEKGGYSCRQVGWGKAWGLTGVSCPYYTGPAFIIITSGDSVNWVGPQTLSPIEVLIA